MPLFILIFIQLEITSKLSSSPSRILVLTEWETKMTVSWYPIPGFKVVFPHTDALLSCYVWNKLYLFLILFLIFFQMWLSCLPRNAFTSLYHQTRRTHFSFPSFQSLCLLGNIKLLGLYLNHRFIFLHHVVEGVWQLWHFALYYLCLVAL